MDNDAHSLQWEQRKNDLTVARDEHLSAQGVTFSGKDWAVVKMKPIHIKDRAWIGFNSIILKNVTIGTESVIGAGAVVTDDVPDYSVVAGNPCKIIKKVKA
jgi:galactoside O-acetyltransferase